MPSRRLSRWLSIDDSPGSSGLPLVGSCLPARALDRELGGREAGLGRDVRIGTDEEERRRDEDHGGGDGPPAPQRVAEHDQAERKRGDRRPRVREEQADREQRRQPGKPARVAPPRRGDKDRRQQHVRRRERAEERRDEPAQRPLVAGVVDPVLGQAGEAAVLEPELLPEPAGHTRVAPGLQGDGVDVDQPPRRDDGGDAEDQPAGDPAIAGREGDAAAEEVAGDRGQVVPDPVEDPARGGVAAEPVLRDQRVEDDDRRVREREPVDPVRPEGDPAPAPDE